MPLKTIEQLLSSLQNTNWTVRSSVVSKLAELNDNEAFETILKVLREDRHKFVRQKCVEELTKLKRKESVDALIDAMLNDNYHYVRELSAMALAEIGDLKAVEPIMQALKKYSNEKKYQFISSLGKLGDNRALDLIISNFNTSDSVMIFSVAHALENFQGEEKAIQALISYLEKSKNDTSKAYVMNALGTLKAREAVPAILNSHNKLLQHNVVNALNKIGDFDNYLKLLEASSIQIQIALVQALQNSGKQVVFDTLFQLYKKTKNKQLKLEIVKRLFEFQNEKNRFELEDRILYYVGVKDKKSINELGHQAEDELIKLIALRETEQKVLVFDALADIKSVKAVPYIVKYLKSKIERLQTRAAYNLGRIGDNSATIALIESLQNKAKQTDTYNPCQFTVAALGSIGDKRAIEPLNQLLKELLSGKILNDYIVTTTIDSLKRLKSQTSKELLTNALRNEKLSIRKAAARAIEDLNYELTEKEKVFRALAGMDWGNRLLDTETGIETLIELFNDEPLTTQQKIIEIFCRNQAKKANETVLKWLYKPSIYMSDPEVQKSLPMYQNLFGTYTEIILYTAAYLDCEIKQLSMYTFEYHYSFEKSLPYIENLQKDNSQIATNLLFLLKEKSYLELLTSEHEEYYSHAENFYFKEQNELAERALDERKTVSYSGEAFLRI